MRLSRLNFCILWGAATFAWPPFAFAAPVKEVTRFEELIFSDRLVQIYNRQKFLARRCSGSQAEVARDFEDAIRSSSARFAASANASEAALRKSNLRLIEEVRDQHRRLGPCLKNPMEASPRKNIDLIFLDAFFESVCVGRADAVACAKRVLQMNRQLRPHCFKPERAADGFYEDYACLAGDELMADSLRSAFADHRFVMIHAFGLELLTRSLAAKSGATIDLSEAFAAVSYETSAESFLVSWAALASSGPAGTTGYLQGLEERWLIEDLAQGLSATLIHEHFKLWQRAKIFYAYARRRADRKGVKFSLGAREITTWNRHNIMAAYLGCKLSRTMPVDLVERYVSAIGVGYESRDFISHLQRGTSWQRSTRNFQLDTNRYRESVRFGIAGCSSIR